MKSHRLISSFTNSFIASLVIVCCAALSATAQSAQTFISARNGSDIGNCAVTAPCRTVTYALTQVQADGQVLIVDSGDYDSSIKISQNVTIAAAPGVAAVFSADGASVDIFSFNYGASSCPTNECHTLILRNLIFDGQGVTQDVMRASRIRLLVEGCAFTRSKSGVFVDGPGFYQFKNCVFRSLEDGLTFLPNGAAHTRTLAVVEGCRFEAVNFAGINGNTDPVGSDLKVVVRDSLFDHLIVGVRSSVSAGGSIQMDLERCEITNSSIGVLSVNPGSFVRVSNSTIVGNTNGLVTSASGALLTRGNNTIEGNITDGVFTGSFLAK